MSTALSAAGAADGLFREEYSAEGVDGPVEEVEEAEVCLGVAVLVAPPVNHRHRKKAPPNTQSTAAITIASAPERSPPITTGPRMLSLAGVFEGGAGLGGAGDAEGPGVALGVGKKSHVTLRMA